MHRYLWLLFLSFNCFGQTPDSVRRIDTVYLRAPLIYGKLLNATGSIGVLNQRSLENHAGVSLVTGMNTIAGVRMEERSPGSYRLSVRGSLLRSPFGIRNIKIYADDFSLTDAGGNTYLNLLDAGTVSNIEILKGPASSIFGANTGGAILLDVFEKKQNQVIAEAGSFGLLRHQVSLHQRFGLLDIGLHAAYQRADGYRQHSAMDRKFLQVTPSWRYRNGSLKALLFYSDLDYETPGGLTLQQFESDPALARPASSTLPGAVTQNAGIRNRSIFTGINNTYALNDQWKHIISVQYLNTDLQNPFITNYETRKEHGARIRSYFSFAAAERAFLNKMDAGFEASASGTLVENTTNNSGERGSLTSEDRLTARQVFGFLSMQFIPLANLTIDVSSSLNFYGLKFRSVYPAETPGQHKNFSPQLMPRVALNYQLTGSLAMHSSISRGYSPPTIAEIRASDAQINTALHAEHGYNYELGFRLLRSRVLIDVTTFHFRLRDAIVRRVSANDTEFFVNAGGTVQTGLELQSSLQIIPYRPKNIISSVRMSSSYTYSHFRFRDYVVGSQNLNGNRLTGIPEHQFSANAELEIRDRISMFGQFATTSTIWLNDANTVSSEPFYLLSGKVELKAVRGKSFRLNIYAGGENLLNMRYSLGNDLNAANGRFFNAAPVRNFYGGVKAIF